MRVIEKYIYTLKGFMKFIPRFSVEMAIEDVLYLSYFIAVEKVRPFVPAILRLDEVAAGKVFISVVALRCRDVRLFRFPSLTFSCCQLNIHTYVIDPLTGDHGVFFIKSGITSRRISYVTRLLQVPWDKIQFEVHATREKDN